jgi:hypothetical protein
MGTIPRPKGFPIEGKKYMKELKNKFDSKTCFVLIVRLGNRYPRQLLNRAVHKVLFSDSTIKL